MEPFSDEWYEANPHYENPKEALVVSPSSASPTCSIADVQEYLQMRIEQTEQHIAVEKLAGNLPKQMAEESAMSELLGVMEFIQRARQ